MLEEVVQVLLEHLEDETGVILVREALVSADEVELVGILLAQTRQNAHLDLRKEFDHQKRESEFSDKIKGRAHPIPGNQFQNCFNYFGKKI